MLRPPTIAHMLLPLPRCATTVRPAAAFASNSRQHAGDVLVGQAVEAVAPHATLGDRRRQREGLRHLRLRAMEGGVEAGDLRQVGPKLRDDLDRLRGCAAGAAAPAGSACASAATTSGVDAHACANARPPCTTRWPTATSLWSAAMRLQELDQVGDAPRRGRAACPRPRSWRRSRAPCASLATKRGAV